MQDRHIHTTFSDGAATPEEMVLAAIRLGMDTVGISDHSYTSFDPGYCMEKDALPAYRTEIARLKEKYRGRITVLCGIEQDYYGDIPAEGFDYVIGSVHYVKTARGYAHVEETQQQLAESIELDFGGDPYALAEAYYALAADVLRKTGASIVGHFDVITKFCEKTPSFDETHPRYVAAWQKAADRLLREGAVFEINFGAMAHGYRTSPYPAKPIRDYILARGGKFILSSDAHAAGEICHAFDTAL